MKEEEDEQEDLGKVHKDGYRIVKEEPFKLYELGVYYSTL
jgi:hypothetical protein